MTEVLLTCIYWHLFYMDRMGLFPFIRIRRYGILFHLQCMEKLIFFFATEVPKPPFIMYFISALFRVRNGTHYRLPRSTPTQEDITSLKLRKNSRPSKLRNCMSTRHASLKHRLCSSIPVSRKDLEKINVQPLVRTNTSFGRDSTKMGAGLERLL